MSETTRPLDLLEGYRPVFLTELARFNRSEGLDSSLTAEWRIVEGTMNKLLEGYHSFLGGQAFTETVSGLAIPVEEAITEEIPIRHTSDTYPAKVEFDGRGEQ